MIKRRGHHTVVQGRRIDEDGHPAHEGKQRADREAKTVKQRHGIEDTVVVRQVRDRKHLPHVGEDIAMAEFNAFGHTFRAARKQDHRGVSWLHWGTIQSGGNGLLEQC